MKPALVTVFGGSGFIGRHVVRLLAQRGVRIRVAVRHPNEALFLKLMGDVGQIQLLQTNIRIPESIDRALDGADAVVNLVGILNPTWHQKFDAIHHLGAQAIAQASARAGVRRLVHVSAIGADEDSPSAYGRSKAAGEAAVRTAFTDATILRPSIVFGPEDDFFNRFAAMAQMSPILPLIGGGETRFQPIYVADVAGVAVKAAMEPGFEGRAFELGGPEVMSFREILELVCAETDRKRTLVPYPAALAKINAWFLQMLPNPLLTVDQVHLLEIDNVVGEDVPGIDAFGITPTPVRSVLPSYLDKFRVAGRFTEPSDAAA